MKKGFFITLEGPEGSGKSSVAKKLYDYYTDLGLDVLLTKEPGGVDIAEQIRNVVLNKRNTSMDCYTELLLYVAARRQHLVEKVIPALNEGKIVICDRFVDSTVAYQGYGRGIDLDTIRILNEIATKNYPADLTLLLDVAPEVGLTRIADNNRETNRLDEEGLKFHHLVRNGYLKLAEDNPERIVTVNAGYDLHTTYLLSRVLLDKFLQRNGVSVVEPPQSNKKILVFVGPSGSGKTTLVDLLGTKGYPELISHTTRQMRAGDIEGKNYFFVSPEEFEKQDFAEVVNYAGNRYGLSKEEINRKLKDNPICVVAAAIDGAVAIKEQYPAEAHLVFLEVNKAVCEQRMIARGDTSESIQRRLSILEETKEFENWKYCDMIVNSDIQNPEQISRLIESQFSVKKILVFIGASGSGKTALVRGLNKDGIPVVVTHTTRKMRANEFNGVDYHFVSEDEFKSIDKVEFAEYAGNYYGISKQEIDSKLSKHDCVAVITSIEGGLSIRKAYPQSANLIFVSVDKKTAISRMLSRGDKPQAIEKRVRHMEDAREFDNWRFCDFTLNNSRPIDQTLNELRALISVIKFKDLRSTAVQNVEELVALS